ncbi:MAG: carbohydrate ABC transporter substrate-binding protein [Clostridia bacterium]|nr:carbohydrate ABC transporter substrate-binding protein [Clostridia bacterium]MCR4576535.1 ABC transporter substrate-binding protein [Clostridiales bacterium]
MKTSIKRILALAVALMMLFGVTSAFAEDDFAGTITVSLYSAKGVEAAWNAVGKAYMEKHPNVNVVVDLKPQDGYADWVKAQFQSYDDVLPEADIVYGNLAGSDRTDKVINYFDYAFDDDPYYDGEWNEAIAFDMQNKDVISGMWDCVSVTGVQVLWFYNADIFAEVGVQPPKTWDEFIDVCEKLEAAGYQPLAVPGTFNSFWANQMGWIAQCYADQTTRSQIEIVRAHEGDYCYDPEIDGKFVYDPTDPHNDDGANVNNNGVRFWKAFLKDGTIRADSEGMKTVWSNFAKIFPKYAGGENFYGTDGTGAKTLFYQGKAAIWLDGSWFFGDYLNTMDTIEKGEAVTLDNSDGSTTSLEGLKKFGLGTFAMPSMEGEGIEAPARTIEVATGFLSAIKKDIDHDDMVVDFMMFYSSPEGYSTFLSALIEAGGTPDGLPLVKGIELEGELATMFSNITYIGNCQKGFCQALARGIGDNQEALRAWYTYSMDLLNGKITVDEWAAQHQANQTKYAPDVMASSKISMNDLENPQNEPTGN